tara:strand:- start:154 stop:342 length:189 start_codon:yes stop_codon:yes gene_type:complete
MERSLLSNFYHYLILYQTKLKEILKGLLYLVIFAVFVPCISGSFDKAELSGGIVNLSMKSVG